MDEFLCNHNDMFMMVVYGNEKSQTPLDWKLGPENSVFLNQVFTNGTVMTSSDRWLNQPIWKTVKLDHFPR